MTDFGKEVFYTNSTTTKFPTIDSISFYHDVENDLIKLTYPNGDKDMVVGRVEYFPTNTITSVPDVSEPFDITKTSTYPLKVFQDKEDAILNKHYLDGTLFDVKDEESCFLKAGEGALEIRPSGPLVVMRPAMYIRTMHAYKALRVVKRW